VQILLAVSCLAAKMYLCIIKATNHKAKASRCHSLWSETSQSTAKRPCVKAFWSRYSPVLCIPTWSAETFRSTLWNYIRTRLL